MPAIANIAIADGKGTPITHTFVPMTTDGSLAKLINRASGTTLDGAEQLWIEYRAPKTKTGAHSYVIKMVRPVVGTVDGQEVVIRKSTTNCTLNFAANSTAADRKDEVILMSNLFANATFRLAVENLEPYY